MNNPDQSFLNDIKQEQLHLLYKALPMSQTVAMVNAAVLVFFSWGLLPFSVITTWLSIWLLVTLIRLLDYKSYTRTSDNREVNWEKRFIWGAGGSGVVWGAAAWVLFPEESAAHQMLVIFVLAGITAGGLTTLSSNKKAYITFLCLALLPLSVRLFLSDSTAGLMMGALVLLYIGALISAGKLLHNNIKQNILLRLQAEVREKKLAENEVMLIAANEAAEAANEAKGAFLANMSHELRTPMNGIIGMTHLVMQSDLSSEQKNMVGKAHTSAKSLLAILNDILDFSKVEADKLELESVPFNLRAVLNQVIQYTKPAAEEKNISLRVKVKLVHKENFIGDPVRLGQVLTNLVGNAIKFSSTGSHVTIRIVENDATKTDRHASVTFLVEDEGIGISENQLDMLFQPFTQADVSTTRKYGGTGLGLTITQNLVSLMGGRLSVESQPDVGSSFAFTLDFLIAREHGQEELTDKKSEADSLYQALHGKKVLLVEDNEINQQVAEGILKQQKIDVVIANHGQEAIEFLSTGHFDAVLMDCQMPVLDGYEATKIIRSKESDDRIPIIAMTAHAMKGDKEKALGAGMDDYITKPIDPSQIWECLSKYFT
ncbi:ATP-binding protein [Neptuniibacter sp.]|uniref:ATP-binding protein n=1 Tax=Neptuniibacter sp. TaxID=1962643 RepID=UPI002616AB5D|nr:ATP-binding protein [Neptuniibacter sp.]MCP4596134.1 response regulator [Neptuniibacter sp.]